MHRFMAAPPDTIPVSSSLQLCCQWSPPDVPDLEYLPEVSPSPGRASVAAKLYAAAIPPEQNAK